ncbi:flagellar hook-length control protein FliK [Xenorhabdus eapokensis]|uniref:Flagellar hook-length control protein FliK n=1 Tax=Xenorhabdus eapokensis TaxID=1873482 RepID=A0A1Q5TQC8_9GAMM|nr:flagellar hook-length control protein FliK [Xenorhabdus eapokensis]OKP02443.1 flagellar hook-length control protein FliK [Xenorhabdus eapokensis]
MNLTLLPTDLKFTDKGTDNSQPALNNAVNGHHSSQFGQLLDAETASMRKPTTQADKNSLREGKSTTDKTAENDWPQLAAVPDNNSVTKDKARVETTQQENSAELAVLKDEDLLSAAALSAAIPIQLAGLLTSQTNSAVLAENSPDLMGNEPLENKLLKNPLPEDALPESAWLDSENSTVNTLLGSNMRYSGLTDTNLVEQSKAGEQDKNIQLSAKQESLLNNKTEGSVSLQSELAPFTAQFKLATNNLATNNKAESGKILTKETVSGNHKDPNLLQMSIQATPALTSSTVETASIDSPMVLATPSLLSAGQQPMGQFQLNSTTTSFTTPLLNAHLGSEEWQQQLNQHVLFFNRNGLQQAELRLHPQELGALHIRMSVEDNQAQLHFVSAHQHVRAALEAALPGLRHALAENGIQLAQSSVNSDAQGNGQQAYFADNHANNPNSDANSHAETQESDFASTMGITASPVSAIRVTPQQITSTQGGIDTFA